MLAELALIAALTGLTGQVGQSRIVLTPDEFESTDWSHVRWNGGNKPGYPIPVWPMCDDAPISTWASDTKSCPRDSLRYVIPSFDDEARYIKKTGNVDARWPESTSDLVSVKSVLMSRTVRSLPAVADFGVTEYQILGGGREEANPIGSHRSARVAMTMVRIGVMTRGLEAMERAGAPRKALKGTEWGLVGHGIACVQINALASIQGHDMEHPMRALLISSAVAGVVGAILN